MNTHPEVGVRPLSLLHTASWRTRDTQKKKKKIVSSRKEEVGLEKEIPFQIDIRGPPTSVTSKLLGYSLYGGYLCVLASFVVVVVQLLSRVHLFANHGLQRTNYSNSCYLFNVYHKLMC